MKYFITYGMNGGFGNGDQNKEIIEASNQDEADSQAYILAQEYYQQYEGMYGSVGTGINYQRGIFNRINKNKIR